MDKEKISVHEAMEYFKKQLGYANIYMPNMESISESVAAINKQAQKLAVITRFSYADIVSAMKFMEEHKNGNDEIERACEVAAKCEYPSVYSFVVEFDNYAQNLISHRQEPQRCFEERMGFNHEDVYDRDGNTIKLIAICNNPDDFPTGYIARLFNGTEPTGKTVTGETLEAVRGKIPEGYTMLPRSGKDVGSLVELWIY